MRAASIVALLLCALVSGDVSAKPPPSGIRFLDDDYEGARTKAQRLGVPIFVDVWAPWCHTCLSLRAFVFPDQQLARFANRFVWLAIDTEKDRNARFVANHPVEAWPTLFVIDPADGRVRKTWRGALRADELAAWLDDALAPSAAENDLARARAADARVGELRRTGDDPTCVAEARSALAWLPPGTPRLDVALEGLTCASRLPDGAPKAEADAELGRALAAIVGDAVFPVLADDRSSAYQVLVERARERGDQAEAKRWAAQWAAFLAGEANRASTPAARAVFDAHRLEAQLALGEPLVAVPWLEESARDFPRDYNPHARLARAYLAAGKLTEAQRAISKGLSLVYGPRRARLEATAADIVRAQKANPNEPPPAEQALARTILRELVEIDTSLGTGSTTPAARLVAARLRRTGLPASDVLVLGPTPKKQAVVARLRAKHATKPPLLLLGHLDVVNASRGDWTVDPYVLVERDGFLYGRGTLDMKALVSLWIANVVRLAREGGPRSRDVIVALTPDEEDGPDNGVAWLLAHRPELVQAALALNEGGLGEIKDGRRRANTVQVAEKTYVVFDLRARNKGGHSSLPEPDNAIVRLSRALARVHELVFPARVLPVTKAYFGAMAAFESGATAADLRTLAGTPDGAAPDAGAVARLARSIYYNARLRTTCVPTQVAGGHARNALPQLATATVNCRVLPGERVEDVQAALVRAIDDPAVEIALGEEPTPGPPSPLDPELLGKAARITNELWPGVPVVAILSTGASDGRYLRAAGIPTYGISGLFHDVDDIRAHGRDERISVRAFVEAQEFTYRLIEALIAP